MKVPGVLGEELRSALAKVWREVPSELEFRPVAGGCINNGGRLQAAGQEPLFLKFNLGAPADMFAAEAEGLRAMHATGAIVVPEPLAVSESFLLTSWLEAGSQSKDWAERFAQDLAGMHRSQSESYGFERDNFIGSTVQKNAWAGAWVEFYRSQRLDFQWRLWRKKSTVSASLQASFDRLLNRLDELLALDNEAPCLLHGDLWSGNWMTVSGGRTAIYDPACYYGCRETDLAMTELFGALPAAFYQAYHEAWPLNPGYEQRRDLYHLYHMLNHANLFGSSYMSSVRSIIQRYS